MNIILKFCGLFLFLASNLCPAQNIDYSPLDSTNPIVFKGTYIVYESDTIHLNKHAFFIDGQLKDEEVNKYKYVYNSINAAVKNLTPRDENLPMALYIAPYVYWIDDPDDKSVRVPKNGSGVPYGLKIQCKGLKFYGLTDDPRNVVLACNRGQSLGAKGNFTLFNILGDDIRAENVTFGNYCNVDLVFPLKPELNRKKRSSTIVQAQLIHCNGDRILARNTRFISRLNLCPFVGAKRILFDQCHFESTDDALCGTGVYLNSTFDFYSSKPFYHTTGTGAVFLNCDVNIHTKSEQYFTKANGQLTVIDTRFKSQDDVYLGWRDHPPLQMRNYQNNKVFLNKKPVQISKENEYATIDITQKPVLDAYKFLLNDTVVYNTYNLLMGDDDWDPMRVKETVKKAEKEQTKTLTELPFQLLINPSQTTLETGKDTIHLTAKAFRFGNYHTSVKNITWKIAPGYEQFAILKVSTDGTSCLIIPTNTTNTSQEVVVTASTPSGLEAAAVLDIKPRILPAPAFDVLPTLKRRGDKIIVDYKLDTEFQDESQVNWYRCTNDNFKDSIKVAVSQFNTPLNEYKITPQDMGYYIMASVSPQHIRSEKGKNYFSTSKKAISKDDFSNSSQKVVSTNFKNVATQDQPKVLPGFWTWKHFKPAGRDSLALVGKNAWYYGKGSGGSENLFGLLQTGRRASLFYTPLAGDYTNMKVEMTVSPFKTAGQGFSMADMYMDVLIKFDATTYTGYGLRLIRTTAYSDAISCFFVRYDNGNIEKISDSIATTAYLSPCNIVLETSANKLVAHISSPANRNAGNNATDIASEVEMSTTIQQNNFGGFGINYKGGSQTMINAVKLKWE